MESSMAGLYFNKFWFLLPQHMSSSSDLHLSVYVWLFGLGTPDRQLTEQLDIGIRL